MREADCSTSELTLLMPCEGQLEEDSRAGSFGKTCREASAPIEGWILRPYSKPSARPRFQCLRIENGRRREWSEAEAVFATSRGEQWTLNFSTSPNGAKECFLWQILEPEEDVPTKYYLSARACQGILARAERRKKELPPEMEALLKAQIAKAGAEDKPFIP